ncbi:MAG: helix-turn-helix domain-containing protein [Streptosporangiales bacterium]|nr:helix-turn-helix domain-containing protein [Streptosporangiales bacterium]
MAKAIGPTVPRWQLGERLTGLREEAGMTLAEVADEMDCSEWKIRRIEQGQVGVTRPELRTLLDLYDVEDREPLEELQQLGRQRGWWSRYSRYLAPNHANLLGIESAAVSIRAWEPLVIPGLLQTEPYARGLTRANLQSDEDGARSVEIKIARQKLVWDDDPPAAWYVLDESVLKRKIGDNAIMREQLKRLIDPPNRCTIQILPYDKAEHPGAAGGLTIFEFDQDLHSPIAYIESQAGSLYLEEAELDRCRSVIDHTMALALSPAESVEFIRGVLGRISPDHQEDKQ